MNGVLLHTSNSSVISNENSINFVDNQEQNVSYLYYMKFGLYGGIGQNDICFCFGFILSIALYMYSMVIAILQFLSPNDLCIPFELCFLCLVFQSFAVYILGVLSLRNNYLIRKLYKASPYLNIFISFTTFIPFTSGFLTLFDAKDWRLTGNKHGKTMEIISFGMDLLRYWQAVCIVIIYHGTLNSFASKMRQFDIEIAGLCGGRKLLNNQYDTIEFNQINHSQFVQRFNKMVSDYRKIVNKFGLFIAAYSAFAAISCVLVIWTLIWQWTPNPCNLSGYWYYGHYASEIFFYCNLLLLIIWRLTRNHAMIVRYKNMFGIKVIVKNSNMILEKQSILSNLELIVTHESPFSVFGVTPTSKKLFWIATSVLVPMMWQIYRVSTAGTIA